MPTMQDAIRSAPHDPLAMLALADEMEEQGERRMALLQRMRAHAWMWALEHEEHKLCYVIKGVINGVAWFTSLPVAEQTGPDWDREQWRVYSGHPHSHGKGSLCCLLCDAKGYCEHGQPPRPVIEINRGDTPWLTGQANGTQPDIYAGTTLPDFCALIEAGGGWWIPHPEIER